MLTKSLLFGPLATLAFAANSQLACPPLGPVLPPPRSPSTDSQVQAAVADLETQLRNLTSNFNGTAISIAAQSVHDKPMLDFHYTPPTLSSNGTAKVDNHTIYRIGSISKIFTVFGVLLSEGVEWDHPVTKYLPELRDMQQRLSDDPDAISTPDWDSMTIGSLASHLSGLGADCRSSAFLLSSTTTNWGTVANDISSFPVPWTSLGLPDLGNVSGPACGDLFGYSSCSREEFFRDIGKRHPFYAPFTKSVYSSALGISILGYVLEAVSGQSYHAYMKDTIMGPLGMNSTTTGTEAVDDKKSFIPELSPDQSYWYADLGHPNFSGGFYSNTVDMLTFGVAILSSRLISPLKTRRWLKPAGSTSQTGLLLGAPWEIYRSDELTRDGRLIELYTKSGDMGVYHTKLCLVPDYDVVINVMTSGVESDAELPNRLCSDVARALLPALEAAGKREAEALAGRYTDAASNSSLVLALDDGPGFLVRNWTVRGADVLRNYPLYAGGAKPADQPVIARLYPTNLAAGNRTSWRVHFDPRTPQVKAAQDAAYAWPRSSCTTWATMDRIVYAFNDLGDIVVRTGEHVGLELRGFRVSLKRE